MLEGEVRWGESAAVVLGTSQAASVSCRSVGVKERGGPRLVDVVALE